MGGAQEAPDISWLSSPVDTVSCTTIVLSHGTGWPQEGAGNQLAVAAYGGGQLYCVLSHRVGGAQEAPDVNRPSSYMDSQLYCVCTEP